MLAATIVAIFPSLDNFLGAVTAKLSRPQRRHFYAYLLALTISLGLRKTISAVARQSTVVELINHVIAQHEKGMTPDQIAQQLPINI